RAEPPVAAAAVAAVRRGVPVRRRPPRPHGRRARGDPDRRRHRVLRRPVLHPRAAHLPAGGARMIRCRDVVVEVAGKRLLDGVGFTVPEGGALTIIGPNGAGKSTLLRWLAGIMPGRGHLELAGRPAAGLRRRDRARTVAFVPQSPVIPPGSTVADYVLIGRSPHIPYLGVERTSDLEAVRAALVRLNLEHLADRDVGTLSG